MVAADEAFAALGSDTGGSIRQPAALCGCVGLEADLRPRLALRPDRLRLLARSDRTLHQDRPRLRAAAATPSPGATRRIPPASTSRCPITRAQLGRDLRGVKLGMPREYFIEGIDPQVDAAVRAAIRAIRGARRGDRRGLAAPHRARRRRLLHRRHRRGLGESRALRRRPLRPPRRQARPTCSSSTAARARKASAPR